MKKSTYSFNVEIVVDGAININSDSPLKAYNYIRTINDLQQVVDAMGDSVQWNIKIDDGYYEEFDLGVIAEETIAADTEDYEDE